MATKKKAASKNKLVGDAGADDAQNADIGGGGGGDDNQDVDTGGGGPGGRSMRKAASAGKRGKKKH